MGQDTGSGLWAEARAEFPGIDDQDHHLLGLTQQRQGVMHRPCRLARAIPGDQDPFGWQCPSPHIGHHQRRTAGIHESSLYKGNFIHSTFLRPRLADHDQVGVARDPRQDCRQPFE